MTNYEKKLHSAPLTVSCHLMFLMSPLTVSKRAERDSLDYLKLGCIRSARSQCGEAAMSTDTMQSYNAVDGCQQKHVVFTPISIEVHTIFGILSLL